MRLTLYGLASQNWHVPSNLKTFIGVNFLRLNKMTVFYADDDPDELEMFGYTLAKIDPGIKFLTAENGETALKFLLTNAPPQLIVLDLNMPRRNGMEVLDGLKKDEKFHTVPVIIYSTTRSEKTIQEALALGAARFVSKEISDRELIGVLQRLLGYSGIL